MSPAKGGRHERREKHAHDHLPRGRERGDPRGPAPGCPGVSHGRGRGPLRRLLRGEQGAAGRIRAGAHPRHAPVRIRFRGRGHRRGARRHAAHRRGDDRQLLPAGARPDRQHRGHPAAHVRRPVQRAAGHPHGHRRGQAAGRPARPLVRGLVRAHPGPARAGPGHQRGRPGHALDRARGPGPGAHLREQHPLQHGGRTGC